MFLNHARAVLYGQAIGDALGLPAEFQSKTLLLLKYFGEGPTHYEATRRQGDASWEAGEWSDDTEQALCLLDAYLDGVKEGRDPGDTIDLRLVAQQFLNWAHTNGRGMGKHTAAVLEHPFFTLEPTFAASEVWEKSGRQAAPNGAVMRTSYIGIIRPWDLDWTATVAAECAATTHADPRCIASAVAVSVAIAEMVTGASVEDATAHAVERASKHDLGVVPWILHKSLEDLNLAEGLEGRVKGGARPPIGFTYKCLGAGFWALRQKGDFLDMLGQIIREGGDTDTNGAVAGALLGARSGIGGIPQHLINGMPHKADLDLRLTNLRSLWETSRAVE